MLIHAYRRKEPTPVELFGKNYLFTPNPAGHCVADVEEERAVQRLLLIPEAYREYDVATAPAVSSTPAPATLASTVTAAPKPTLEEEEDGPEPLKGSDTLPAVIDLGHGKTVTLGEVVALAQSRAGLDDEEWNLNDDEDRESLLQGQVDTLREAVAREAMAAEPPTAAPAGPAVDPGLAADGGAGEEEVEAQSSGMVVTNGEQSIDIGAMTAAQVRAFAAEAGVDLPKGNSVKVADLRKMLYEALTQPAA